METNFFNINVYNKLMQANNYLGMADYLQQHPVDDDNAQAQINQQILRLREQAAIQSAILKGKSEEDRQKFMFKTSIDSGIYDSSNPYYKTYKESLWNKLGNSDEEIASKIRIETELEGLNAFCNTIGVTKERLGDFGIKLGNSADGYILEFNKDNPQYHKIAQALYNTEYETHNIQAGIDFIATNTFKTYGLNNKGDIISTQDSRPVEITKMNDMYNAAVRTAESLTKEATNHEYVTKSINTPFLGAADEKLYRLYASGRIDKQTYDEHKKIQTEYYNRLLAQVPFSQIEVYATGIGGDESEKLQLMSDNAERAALSDYIRVAIADNRVTYSASNVGGVTGVTITVSPKPDKEGNIIGDYNKGRQIFVPGLWQDKAEEALNADTAMRATRNFNIHQAFRHDYSSIRGDVLTDFTPYGATYINKDGIIRSVNNDEIINIMDENYFYEDCINLINHKYRDTKGNITDSESIKKYLKTAVSQEVANLYKGKSDEYIKAKYTDLYTAILAAVGVE